VRGGLIPGVVGVAGAISVGVVLGLVSLTLVVVGWVLAGVVTVALTGRVAFSGVLVVAVVAVTVRRTASTRVSVGGVVAVGSGDGGAHGKGEGFHFSF